MTGPAVLALDTQSGEQVWEYRFFENRTDINIAAALNLYNNSVYVSAGDKIIKLSLSNGEEEWRSSQAIGITEQMSIAGNRLYYSTGILPTDTFISVTDAGTGDPIGSFAPSERGMTKGFTPAFDADGEFIINVGVTSIYGYRFLD